MRSQPLSILANLVCMLRPQRQYKDVEILRICQGAEERTSEKKCEVEKSLNHRRSDSKNSMSANDVGGLEGVSCPPGLKTRCKRLRFDRLARLW